MLALQRCSCSITSSCDRILFASTVPRPLLPPPPRHDSQPNTEAAQGCVVQSRKPNVLGWRHQNEVTAGAVPANVGTPGTGETLCYLLNLLWL